MSDTGNMADTAGGIRSEQEAGNGRAMSAGGSEEGLADTDINGEVGDKPRNGEGGRIEQNREDDNWPIPEEPSVADTQGSDIKGQCGEGQGQGEPGGHSSGQQNGNLGDTSSEGLQERQEGGQSQPVQAVEQSVGGHQTGKVADPESDGSGRDGGPIRETPAESVSENDGSELDSQSETGESSDEGRTEQSGEEGSVDDTQRECGPERDGQREIDRSEREGDAIAPSSQENGGEHEQGQSETESAMGGNTNGITLGMVLSERSGLSYEELEEIFDWMRLGTSRVEELRLLGNGVVPQAAEKAFRTLYARLDI